MQTQWEAKDIAQLDEIALQIHAALNGRKKIALMGTMGAGKTTLISALCKVLNVEDFVSSPTFAIVQEYTGKEKIFHFDLYRIKNIQELEDLGFDEYIGSDAYVFIEWPEIIESHLRQMDFTFIRMHNTGDNKRMINLDI